MSSMEVRGETVLMAAACVAGLVGGFVGLSACSLWSDELYTAFVVGSDHSVAHAASRILTDVHPPLYYILITLFADAIGPSDWSLRLFSALLGCVSIALFILLPRKSFSLDARIFGAALAVSSPFWFYQSQNARDYTLSLTIGVVLLHTALTHIDQLRDGRSPHQSAYVKFFFIGLFATLTHYYDMFETVAVLALMFLLDPRGRVRLALIAASVVLIGFLYLRLAIQPHTAFSTKEGWIDNTASAYFANTEHALMWVARPAGWLAIICCMVVQPGAWLKGRASVAKPALRRLPELLVPLDPIMLLCIGTPVGLWLIGFLSSQVVAPNFTDRNWLVSAPFFWGAFARLYDSSIARLTGRSRAFATGTMAVLAVLAGTTILHRGRQYNQPFREAAEMIRAQRSCANEDVPVILFSLRGWRDPAFAKATAAFGFSYYLRGYAPAVPVLFDDFQQHRPEWLASLLLSRMRSGPKNCPILAMAIHGATADNVAALVQSAQELAEENGLGTIVTAVPIKADVMLGSKSATYIGGYAIVAQTSPVATKLRQVS